MTMFRSNTKTIEDICKMFEEKTLVVDETYQRRSIWSIKDKVALIETILLNYVIPELFFWKVDIAPDAGRSKTHIVDGQQRVKAIADFIDGEFDLKVQYLREPESKVKWGGKSFKDLDDSEKTAFWDYDLNVIEINRSVTRDSIIKMFRRLNLTNYSLNDQERRHSNSGEFASLVNELALLKFWTKNKLFNVTEVKRMKDVEFCAVVVLLCRNGITEQPNQEPLNRAYDELSENYKDALRDKEAVLSAIAEVEKLAEKTTLKFLKKRVQLYTVFSVAFYAIESGMPFGEHQQSQFSNFVMLYENYLNKFELSSDASGDESALFDLLTKYKLASSEGINKYVNRMIRFNVLKNFMYELTAPQIEAQKTLLEKFKKFKAKNKEE